MGGQCVAGGIGPVDGRREDRELGDIELERRFVDRGVDPQGATMMTFDGVLEAGEIRGTCRVLAGEDCTFVLARP